MRMPGQSPFGRSFMFALMLSCLAALSCDEGETQTVRAADADSPKAASVDAPAAAGAPASGAPGAGDVASDVAEALQAANLQVFAIRNRAGEENGLHSEFFVNEQLVNIFTTDSSKSVGRHMKPGWNVFSIKTTRIENAPSANGLTFNIGPVRQDPEKDQPVMNPVIWTFGNQRGWDWDRDKGYSFRLDPGVTSTVETYRLFFAGLVPEMVEIHEGAYVLTGEPHRPGEDVPFTGTIFINGHPLNSFTTAKRQLVINPLLKPGKNEIKLVTHRVDGAVLRDNNDLTFTIAGPARYNARQEKFEMKPVADFKGGVGWKFDEKTGAAVNKDNPSSDSVERIIPLFLDEAPELPAR